MAFFCCRQPRSLCADISSSAPSSGGDTVITLYGPTFGYLGEDDDSGVGLFSQLSFITAQSGWYYVRVRGFGGSTILPPYYYTITVNWY